ncbi:MAG: hypothetical protein BGO12_11265 [Verrucomicrobia bacterium 61-8]|nr:MAG: hypothetical protein BGO12_11265 [Verrucomicrobia bacterium 61-8]
MLSLETKNIHTDSVASNMRARHFFYIAGILLLAIAALILWRSLQPNRSLPYRSFQMVETISAHDATASAERKKTQPFQMYGGGGTGKIVDRQGKIILQSGAENPIFRFEVSPDQKRVLVYGGDATYTVVAPDSGEKVRLPSQPPGDQMLGFSWYWKDDQTLVGISGEITPFRDDQAGPAREEPIVNHSVFYLYDLNQHQMSQIALPAVLRTRYVSISAIDEAGKVQLRSEEHGTPLGDASLGWFEIRPID